MRKELLGLLGAGIFSLVLNGDLVAQDKKINKYLAFGYFADQMGNRNGFIENLEVKNLEKMFGDSKTLFLCTGNGNPIYFYNRVKKAYNSLEGARKYWNENRVRGLMSITEINKNGEIVNVWGISGSKPLRKVSKENFNFPINSKIKYSQEKKKK